MKTVEKNPNPDSAPDVILLEKGLERLFPGKIAGRTNWQKIAAANAVQRKFCAITGGPGTGKTRTVARVLALLLEQNSALRIALAAPTGKAAARLSESIKLQKAEPGFLASNEIKEKIPEEAATIHRLLGSLPQSPYFKHNSEHPLPVDVLIIDEASMVDTALMAKTILALPSHARLVLLGDKNQLASVEAGKVFGDICGFSQETRLSPEHAAVLEQYTGEKILSHAASPALGDSVIHLSESFRFKPGSSIDSVSKKVNAGTAGDALVHMENPLDSMLSYSELTQGGAFRSRIADRLRQGFKAYANACAGFPGNNLRPFELFSLFNEFRVLCAVREGPYGVHSVNAVAERLFKEQSGLRQSSAFYAGRPIQISHNDYGLKLFNGDTGLILPDPNTDNRLTAFFFDANGTVRKFLPARLPGHETVYATTVHKSQGSEYGSVLLILPNTMNAVLTRELVYTGITRAIRHVEIWANRDVFLETARRKTERTSGLAGALWGTYA